MFRKKTRLDDSEEDLIENNQDNLIPLAEIDEASDERWYYKYKFHKKC